jgi:poly-gamma-glutamate synthesis protein (capsule biosynthesis protein)
MIYCGDTVFPNSYSNNHLGDIDTEFIEKPKIVNLESLIKLEDMKKTAQGIALSSSKDIIPFLKALNVVSVSQANNHITDFDISIGKQKKLLEKNNIDSFGAGDDILSASMPFFYKENNKKFVVLSYGWDVIGCRYASENLKGVNPMEYKHIFEQVNSIKEKYQDANIILTFHNNYEFELYPQPAHRQMFFDLIDCGVSAIFCHHPHIVGGCEVYNNSPIFYSLGNFYLPETNYNGYDLKYNDNAKIGLCVEYDGDIENTKLYWTYKDENNNLSVTKKESLTESEKLKELTPFKGMNYSEYIIWFKKNRKKKKLLPVYKNYKSEIENNFNSFIVSSRQKVIDFMVRKGIK